MPVNLAGLWVPIATPFAATGNVDLPLLVEHGKRLIAEGATGLAVLGTTSEANSLTVDERRAVIDACIAGGIPPERLVPGTGSAAIGDAIALTRHAAAAGCAGVLLLPPFYYKNITDDGLFAFVARLIEGCGKFTPRILLYHIPQQAVVGWSLPLIARLREAFPAVIVGMKDSSGDLSRVEQASVFGNFAIFPGSEAKVVAAMAMGAVGCVSAGGNVNARAIAELVAVASKPEAAVLQVAVNAVRAALGDRTLIASVKAVIAAQTGHPGWRRVRPPLLELTETERVALLAEPAIRALLPTPAIAV